MRIITYIFILTILHDVGSLFAQSTGAISQYQSTINLASTPRDKVSLCLRYAQEMIETDQLADGEYFAQLALEKATEANMQSEAARAWDALGVTYKDRYNYVHAINAFSQAHKLGEKLGDTHIISRSKYNIGLVFFRQGNYENAEKTMLEALKMRENDHNITGLAVGNLALAELYSERKLYGKSLESYRQSMDYFIEANQLDKAADVAVKLGNLACTLNDTEGALVYHRQAFNLHIGNNDRQAVATDYVNIGNALVLQGDEDEALSSFETAQMFSSEVKDSLTELDAMLCMSALYQKKGNTSASKLWLDNAGKLSKAIVVQPGLEVLLMRVSKSFESIGNTAQAYAYLQLHNAAKDAYFDVEKNRTTMELHTRYQSEITAESHQTKLDQLQQREAMSSKMRWVLLAMLVWACIGLWALWTRNRLKKRDNLLLSIKNAEIDEKNSHLTQLNTRMDDINKRLVHEIAEREMMQKVTFSRAENMTIFAGKLKAPITDVINESEGLIADAANNPAMLAKLTTLQFSINNLQVFVNDLLEYNQIEAGKLIITATDFDIRQVIQRLETSFSAFFKERSKEVFFHIDAKIPTILVGDPSKLTQIISNILQLCLKDNEYKAANLYVLLEHKYRTKCELRLVVKGITKPASLLNDQDTLYKPSEEAVNPNWMISKRLTELQNGTMTTDADDGAEKLNILLPYKLPELSQFGNTANINNVKELLCGKKVLLVEDNKINQLVVKNLLTKMDMDVYTADDGVPALELFEQQYFDLILMDIHLPTLDGYRTAAAMRRTTDGRKLNIPIIALTASAYLTDKDKAMLFQMNEYVGKPFSTEELLEKISLTLSVV